MNGLEKGFITTSNGGFFDVEIPGEVVMCRARGIFRKSGFSPLPGDEVLFSRTEGGGTVEKVLPRKNSLLRPPVANLDLLLLVIPACQPMPDTTLSDGLIAVCESAGIQPVPIVTKGDLAAESSSEIEQIYRTAGFPVFCCSLNSPFPDELAAMLAGKRSALCGNSGAGKSTLLNKILGKYAEKTAGISLKLGRGRHTTRQTTFYSLKSGGHLADTPGFSLLDITRTLPVPAGELGGLFREFLPHLGKCRFSGCSHTVEKDCAVLRAVEQKIIPASRHKSYIQLFSKMKEVKQWETAKRKQD